MEKKRIRVPRPKAEDGTFLPHKHHHKREKIENNIPSVQEKSFESPKPITLSGLSVISTNLETNEIEKPILNEKNKNRLEIARIKRAKLLYKTSKNEFKDHDQTFTQIPDDKPLKKKIGNSKFARSPIDNISDDDIETILSETTFENKENTINFSESIQISENSTLPKYQPPELASIGVNPDDNELWNPNDELKLKLMVKAIRLHLYPRKRRPIEDNNINNNIEIDFSSKNESSIINNEKSIDYSSVHFNENNSNKKEENNLSIKENNLNIKENNLSIKENNLNIKENNSSIKENKGNNSKIINNKKKLKDQEVEQEEEEEDIVEEEEEIIEKIINNNSQPKKIIKKIIQIEEEDEEEENKNEEEEEEIIEEEENVEE